MEDQQNFDEEQQETVAENVETQQEALQDYYGEDNSPSPTKTEDLYSLFWKVIEKPDSSKLGNLDKTELGMLDMSVRDCQAIAILCDIVEYKEVAKWLRNRAEVILATSSSKKGWLVELFVSAKRFTSKEKRMGLPENLPIAQEQKKGFWSRFKK